MDFIFVHYAELTNESSEPDTTMFSRSQAKAFFIIGTSICSVAFIGLTIDTFRQMPEITKAANMNAEVIRGKHLWDESNCMGCHTLLGEGGYYAPELTKVYERRGPEFIRAMLKDPEAMYPGERKMQRYYFSEEEESALIAFFKWIGEMDLQGFPPKAQLLPVAVPQGEHGPTAPGRTQPKIFSQMCVACHSINGQGGVVGPALDGVGDRKTKEQIMAWLTDPFSIKPDSRMPKLPLSEADIAELGAYLSLLRSTAPAGGASANN